MMSQVISAVPAAQNVTYECSFTNLWSAETHPNMYPGSAHWSPPVLAAHSRKYKMWKPGLLASEGVESVAEVGSYGKLTNELEMFAGDFVVGTDQYNRNQQSQTLHHISLTHSTRFLSSITMIAPSPDWFSGFYELKPFGRVERERLWYESFEIETFPWDAGTEKGDTFSLNNPAENPHVPVQQISVDTDTVPANGVLLSPDGATVLPMAKWSCQLVTNTCADSDRLMRGRKNRGCDWVAERTERRCQKRWRGNSLSKWCPETCGETC
jgi:hypothetical protein